MPITVSGVRSYDRNTGGPPPSNDGQVNAVAMSASLAALAPVVTGSGGGGGTITHGRQINASNTGIANAGLTRSQLTNNGGGATYSTAGQVITNRLFTGTVTLSGNNITLRNCQIEVSGLNSYGVKMLGTGCLVENCTILPPSSAFFIGILAQGSSSSTIRRCDVTTGENLVSIYGPNVLVEECYLHGTSTASDPAGHTDVIEVYNNANGTTIQRCKLLMAASQQSLVNVAPWSGSANNVTVDDNYIDGGNYHITVDLQSAGTIQNSRFRRNDMGGHTATFVGRYAALLNSDGRAVVNTEAQLAANPNAILFPTSGVDVNHWVDCSDLSPDKTGQVVIP